MNGVALIAPRKSRADRPLRPAAVDTLLVSRTSLRLHAVFGTAFLVALIVLSVAAPAVSGAPRAGPGAPLAWARSNPPTSPPSRSHAAAAYDPSTNTTVVFGGTSGTQVLGDTWTWDGATWTAATPAVSPPPLESASMTYDGISHRMVLFGGAGVDGVASGATWSWDGASWALLSPPNAPPARYAASFVAQGQSGASILFGGLTAAGSPVDDTWSWDGKTWAQLAPATSPSARSGAAATYDAKRGVIVLFGGATVSEARGDTWTWDGARWAQQQTAVAPPVRTDASMAYDAGSESEILFGGGGLGGSRPLSDTWLWNGSAWSTSLTLSALPIFAPPARAGVSLAIGPKGRVVLFGGKSDTAAMNDTWLFGTDTPSTTATPQPPVGSPGGATTTVPGPSTSTTVKSGPPPTTGTEPAPTAHPVPTQPPLAVPGHSLRKGDSLKLSGSGFEPSSMVTIIFRSTPIVLAHVRTDAKGQFSTTVSVPSDAPPGEHHVEAVGTARDGGQAQLVGKISILAPPAKHSWVLPAFMVALTVLVAAGAGAVLTMSSRWQQRG